MKKGLIIVVNILMLVMGIILSVVYSNHLTAERTELTRDAFTSTVEAMVRVSMGQLSMQQEHVNNWSDYINANNMTVDEAMTFLREICTEDEVQAQILDYNLDSDPEPNHIEGWSTRENVVKKGDYTVNYQAYSNSMITCFRQILEENSVDSIYVTDSFYNPTDGMQVVAFGRKVTLHSEEGKLRDYLLLRLIYLDKLQDQWVFPTGYEDAEIGLITTDGDYIIRSKSMKSENFFEFIRAYNDLTYPQKDALQESMANNTGTGVLEYDNARGEEAYWVYAGLQGDYNNWMIVGYVPVASLETYGTDWPLVFMVVGILLLLFLIDGVYFIMMNRQLRTSMNAAYEASQAKTRFLSSMSHDIRTPMNAIIGMTTIAKAQINDRRRLQDCLDKITLASNHLLTLINDILDISRVESGRLVLNPTVFSLSDMLDNLQNMMRTQIAAKELDFQVCRVHLAQNYLYADELRLNQIFINILSNAVKYTPNGGRVTLTMQEEPLAEDRVRLIYIVADTGIGMDEKLMDTIFQPFTRAKDSRIDTIEGSGLGLAIVKQMVDAMDGTITVESELGEGSVFRVEIDLPTVGQPAEGSPLEALREKPAADGTEADEEPSGADAPDGTKTAEDAAEPAGTAGEGTDTEPSESEFAGMHLLIAEDNNMNWEIIHELLSYCNIESERAENGRICVDKLMAAPEGTYRAVLMDIQMPVMNGREAARAIRSSEIEWVRSIPIIAMTADAFAEDVRLCMEAGMNGHIAKPIDMKLLLKELRKL